jgi:ribosomal protein L13E
VAHPERTLLRPPAVKDWMFIVRRNSRAGRRVSLFEIVAVGLQAIFG